MKGSSRSAFSLIELLVVVAILGIIVGIFFSGFSYVVAKQNGKQAKMEITAIRTALENYRLQYGDYPRSCFLGICTNEEILFLSLAGFPHDSPLNESNFRHPNLIPSSLMSFDLSSYDEADIPNASHQQGNTIALWFMETLGKDPAFIDPWGNEYVYEFPREDGDSGFMLFSKGPDGKTTEGYTEDDIR